MTHKKDLKKLVRARMAKTGESYAAARAQLTKDGERCCKTCGQRYSEETWVDSHYFDPPYDYRSGCREYCLACWLGVGPTDFPSARP